MKKLAVALSLITTSIIYGQTFYFGNDLSYVNQMEDCGAVFKENGEPKDVYQIFADHGTNLVRLRLWVDPTWQNPLSQPDGVKPQYSDFEDIKEAIQRSKAAGMQVMLGFQLSDFWADPGRQVIPARWSGVAENLDALKDSVYNYVYATLEKLNNENLMPEIVKIGNENNSGILVHKSMDENYRASGSVSSSWSRHAQLYNIAIKAVRDMGKNSQINPKIALHCADIKHASWWYSNIISNGVTDFDIMGFSYYYAWHESSIKGLGNKIKELKSNHPAYEPMVVETGYLWTQKNYDQLGNIINTPDPAYLPVSPGKQLEYMVDYTREVMKAGGAGVVFWESAWVSTPCRTPWGKGSSHEHVAYFHPKNTNFMENGGGRWMESVFYENLEAKKVTFKVDMQGQDVENGVYISGSWLGEEGQIVPMQSIGNNVYYQFAYLNQGDTNSFYFLNANDLQARETVPTECALVNGTDRKITMPGKDTTILVSWENCSLKVVDNVEDELQGSRKNNIRIFPNPNNGMLNISMKPFNDDLDMEIIDCSGKTISKHKIDQGQDLAVVDISGLAPNVYFVKFSENNNIVYRKLVLNAF